MTRRDFRNPPDDERVSFYRPEHLPGVEVPRADKCVRSWVWFHTTYSVCNALEFPGSAQYVYRARVRTAGAKHLLIMEPGEVHASRMQTAPATFRVLFIPQGLVVSAAEELGVGPRSRHFSTEPLAHRPLRTMLCKLHRALESSTTSALERQSRFAACLRGLLEVAAARTTLTEPPQAAWAACASFASSAVWLAYRLIPI